MNFNNIKEIFVLFKKLKFIKHRCKDKINSKNSIINYAKALVLQDEGRENQCKRVG